MSPTYYQFSKAEPTLRLLMPSIIHRIHLLEAERHTNHGLCLHKDEHARRDKAINKRLLTFRRLAGQT